MTPGKIRTILVAGALLGFLSAMALGLAGAPPVTAYLVGGAIIAVLVVWLVPHINRNKQKNR